MHPHPPPRGRAAIVAAISFATLLPAPSHAAGLQVSEQNVSGLGSAYAGQAALADDASTIFFNPAGMTRLQGRGQAVVGVSIIKPSSAFTDNGSCTPYLGAGAGTTACPFGADGNLGHRSIGAGAATTRAETVPFAYLAWRVSPPLWLGLGFSGPFGLSSNRDPDWVGRFHAIESHSQAVNVNPSVAWQPAGSPVSVGAGVDAQRLSAILSNAVSYRSLALSTQSPALIAAVPAGSEGVATIKADDWGYGWNAGVAIAVSESLHLGLSYRSPVRFALRGTVRFDGRPAAFAAVPALTAALADGDVHSDIKLPDILSAALAWEARPGLTVMADWTRTGWHSIHDLVIVRGDGSTLSSTPFRFRSTSRAGIGVAWRASEAWTLRAGVARDEGAVEDAFRTPRLPDANRSFYAVGGRWEARAALASGVSVDLGIAWSRFETAPIAQPNQETATSGPRGSLVGSMATRAVIGGVQLNWSFP